MVHKSNSSRAAHDNFQSDMAIMRQVMEKDWVVLRALALSDQHPELNAEALVEMAKQQYLLR